jgi:hypothetical protein
MSGLSASDLFKVLHRGREVQVTLQVVAQGIYEFVGKRLRLCIGPERPVELSPAGRALMIELERVTDACRNRRCRAFPCTV